MASLRGGTQLWDAETVSQGDTSPWAQVGPGPYVTVYIDGSAASVDGVFGVQVAGVASQKPGLNEVDSSDPTDGGLTWYDYDGATALAVPNGTSVAFDLSPFGPSLFRLIRTDANGDDTFSAVATSFGPN